MIVHHRGSRTRRLTGSPKNLAALVRASIYFTGLQVKALLPNNLQRLTTFAVGQTSKLVVNFSLFLLHLGVVTTTMFFLFRDGDRLPSRVKEAMPPARERTEMHTLVLFLSIFGGLKVFDLRGLVHRPGPGGEMHLLF